MKINKNLYFTLHSSVIPVKGITQSLICDLQLNSYTIISNDLCEILLSNTNGKVKDVFIQFSKENHIVLKEMFQFLIDKNYIYLSKTPSNILPLDFTEPLYSEEINNAIIDIDLHSDIKSIQKFINELSQIGCKNISLRFFGDKFNTKIVIDVLNLFSGTTIRYIELTIHQKIFKGKNINDLFDKFIRLNTVFVYAAKKEKILPYKGNKIFFSEIENINANSCGKIEEKYFFSDMLLFSLNKNVNSCLFGKISMNTNGEIMNCPALKSKYGNINDSSINKTLQSDNFKELWYINKDQIDVCKDCEYRYVCSDCRAFLNKNYEKPFKCNYDPYKGIWKK